MATFAAQVITARDSVALNYANEGAGTTGLKKGMIAKKVAGLIVPWAAAADTNLVLLAADALGVAGTPIAYQQIRQDTVLEATLSGVALVGDVAGATFDLTSVAVAGVGTVIIANRAATVTPRLELLETRLPPTQQNGTTGDTNIRALFKVIGSATNWA